MRWKKSFVEEVRCIALEIFKLVGSVFVDTDKANKSLSKADRNAEGVGTTLLRTAKSAGQFALKVGTAAVAAGTAIVALAETTRECRTEQGKLLTAFEASDFAAGAARKTYSALVGVLGDSGQAVEASSHLAKLCTTEEELAQWATICTGVYGAFGASLPIEGLTEAANETAKTGKLTGSLADALNWAGVSEDDFQASLDACNSEQERQALITRTLNGLYSDSAALYRENNAEVIAANAAQDRLNTALASAAGVVEPIITKGKELLSGVLERVTPYLEVLATEVIPSAAAAADGFGNTVNKAKNGLKELFAWVTKHRTALKLLAVGFGTLTAAVAAYNVQQAIRRAGGIAEVAQLAALQVAIWGLEIAEWAHTAAAAASAVATTAFGAAMNFLTSPITLVILAIGALIAVVVLLAEHWDEVKTYALRAWESIKSAFATAGEWLAKAFSLEKIKSMWSGLTAWFKNLLNGVVTVFQTIGSAIGNAFKTPLNAIIRGINAFIGGLNKIKIPDWVANVGGKGINIPTIPYLQEGGVLERGQVGLLEGNGAEAVVPLHNNRKWISAVAEDMAARGVQSGTAPSDELLTAFLRFLELLPDILLEALDGTEFEVNGREFGRLVRAVR